MPTNKDPCCFDSASSLPVLRHSRASCATWSWFCRHSSPHDVSVACHNTYQQTAWGCHLALTLRRSLRRWQTPGALPCSGLRAHPWHAALSSPLGPPAALPWLQPLSSPRPPARAPGGCYEQKMLSLTKCSMGQRGDVRWLKGAKGRKVGNSSQGNLVEPVQRVTLIGGSSMLSQQAHFASRSSSSAVSCMHAHVPSARHTFIGEASHICIAVRPCLMALMTNHWNFEGQSHWGGCPHLHGSVGGLLLAALSRALGVPLPGDALAPLLPMLGLCRHRHEMWLLL